ncbi:MAG: FKBP-type peptidyl-prolyl cis-trans isomerase [Gemmatimonadaceae bacterium]|nr:FKBP-type peptidyl-prolyl cis-trans isomerase [Gemmatimonadaceae bacterium]
MVSSTVRARRPVRRTIATAVGGVSVALTAACASAPATPPSTSSATEANLGLVDTRIGTGARATTRQCLYVHYVGTLADGRLFESSRTPLPNGQTPSPIVFELGTGSVMPGWEKGLPAMQVGGTRRLFVPYRLAYGASGRPPAIPPRTDLVFDIELMAVAAPLPTSSNAPRAETARTCPAWTSVNRQR